MSEIIFENTTNNITFAVDQRQINFQHTQPQISFTAVPGIGSGIEEAPIDGLPYDRLNGGWVEDQRPITESVTKTVAADGDPAGVMDFDTFDEAMIWACAQTSTGARITLSLEDGVHYAEPPTTNSWFYELANGKTIAVVSASSDKSLCTITLENAVTPDYAAVFRATFGYFIFNYITIDAALGSLSNADKITIFSAKALSKFYSYQCTFKNADRCFDLNDCSLLTLNSVTIDSFAYGIICASNSLVSSYSDTINNCTVAGMYCYDSGNISISGTPIFSGNSLDTNIPINEIQPDGSYITDATVPLIQTESVGTTAERPTARQIGHGYFDTTLGYQINWNGTNWVDATGSIV